MRPHQSFYAKHEAVILGSLSVILIIGVWQAAWSAGMISPLFFSSPTAIVKQFAIGFSIATITGVVFGVLIGWYRRLRLFFDPFLNALYATPRVAMVPLIIIWFGIGIWSKVFIVFLSAFFPILVNTVGGVRALDRDLLRAAKAYCASDWQVFTTLAIPGSVPFILTGIRQGVALGLIGVVVGEMVGSSQGVGFMVAYGGQTFNTDTLFVGMIVIAFSGILLTWIAERLERRFSRWRPER